MKSDAVLAAFKYFLDGNREDAVSILRQIEASEARAGKMQIAERIRRLIDSRMGQMIKLPDAPDSLRVIEPRRRLESLILTDETRTAIEQMVREWRGQEALAEYGLEPRRAMLLHGPSGNGKTAIAEAVAREMGLPLAVVAYNHVIDSYRGATAAAIGKVFGFARRTPCVLLCDEADSIVSTRIAGARDAGKEDNRTVNQVLIDMDAGTRSLVVFATNMSEDLDPAFTRRVALKLSVEAPTDDQRREMIDAMVKRWPMIGGDTWERHALQASSFAEIEALAADAARHAILQAAPV